MPWHPKRHEKMYQKHFGDLVVLKKTGQTNDRGYVDWLCRCSCGQEVVVSGDRLRAGRRLSCGINGHFVSVRRKQPHARHAPGFLKAYARELSTWRGIKQRCFNKNSPRYADYGGRGITMHEPWKNSFEQFVMDVGARPKGYNLDRLDVNGSYVPGNVRWAPRGTESQNQRQTVFIEVDGKLVKLAEFVRANSEIDYATVFLRLKMGWKLDEALTFPKQRGGHKRTRGQPVRLLQPQLNLPSPEVS